MAQFATRRLVRQFGRWSNSQRPFHQQPRAPHIHASFLNPEPYDFSSVLGAQRWMSSSPSPSRGPFFNIFSLFGKEAWAREQERLQKEASWNDSGGKGEEAGCAERTS
eukprot:TRINITY_DN13350_c0_g3_i1.p1 TRINITY_DN13350_c0_g3~~TRINITY_DN13350_c0_g3_i1.p1  ORF type:complete len:108 (-),score=17.15 TRINITY_DN13350_c0_g3_i1:44-367(-)